MNKEKEYVFIEPDFFYGEEPSFRTVSAKITIELGLKLKIEREHTHYLNYGTKQALEYSIRNALGTDLDVCILRTNDRVEGSLSTAIETVVNEIYPPLSVRTHHIKYAKMDPLNLKELLLREVVLNENVEIATYLTSLKTIEQKLKNTKDTSYEELHQFRAVLGLSEAVVQDLSAQFDKESGFRISSQLHKKKGGCE